MRYFAKRALVGRLERAVMMITKTVASKSCHLTHIRRYIIRSSSTVMNSSLTIESISPVLKKVEYAVRGPIVIKASEIEKELEKGAEKPFDRVIKANIGDCHAMGQTPITYIRQVIAACTYPPLMEQSIFPHDVNKKSKSILDTIRGSVGCYSEILGLAIVRKHIAEYIERRDGYPCDVENILVGNGAGANVKLMLNLFASESIKSGVMIPIPQYPLYSATVQEYKMQQVGYYLNEDTNWSLDINELKRALEEARKTCKPRCLCVINPGNPTGQVLSYENIKEIIIFAKEEGLFLMADEVYQDNIYGKDCEFHSFKKVLYDMGKDFYEGFQMASFHSCSKGFMGECGLRGGYMEVLGLDADVRYELRKLKSVQLPTNVMGQLALDCIVDPPKIGEPSYELFVKEKTDILSSLKLRAQMVYDTLNKIDGVSCNEVSGAMYAFPRIHLPEKAIEKARSLNQEPDFYYCSQLLEETGICVVPGSGFKQKDDTYHFRMTILPPVDQLKTFLEKLEIFHIQFLKDHNS